MNTKDYYTNEYSSTMRISNPRRIGKRWIRGACLCFFAMGIFLFTSGSVAVNVDSTVHSKKISSEDYIHLELRPTAFLVGERRRQRRRNRTRKLTNRESNNTNRMDSNTEERKDWFHPQVRAIYAGLHAFGEQEDDDTQTHLEKEHFRDFVKYRHLSRFERHFRERMGVNLHPNWSGNYSDPNEEFLELHDPSVLASEIKQQHCNSRNLLASLIGGKFDRYQGVPLSQGYGTHYVHLWVGSPVPQRQSVIVDTGSHFTAFPVARECSNCGEYHTDPPFDPQRSDTFRTLRCPSECLANFECEFPKAGIARAQKKNSFSTTSRDGPNSPRCSFSQAYTEGSSWSAYQASDLLYCGGGADMMEAADPLDIQYSLRFVFGCLKSNSGLFVTQLADGIMGMSAHEMTLPKQLYNKRKIKHNMFAMCFRKELRTSKKGVTAGSMTLGGYSSALDTSPMVYARNIRQYGWYTVYVEKIYLATEGGTKFLFDEKSKPYASILKENSIVPISDFDPSKVNRDRGVIVDSGTTDTYLPSSIRKEFFKAWKGATGTEYSNTAIYLTLAQLKKLPTLLVQLQASGTMVGESPFSNATENNFGNGRPVLGQVGYLDPDHPSDVLLAIPATSYMEYNPTLKLYTSRLFFTESRGGVIGANAMQGHNVLFDWQHGRIGFAQSSCIYDLIAGKNDNHGDFGGSGRGGSTVVKGDDDCMFTDDGDVPILTQTCLQSIANNPSSMAICKASESPTNIEVEGMEIWTLRIENSGSDPFKCEDAIREWSESKYTKNQIEPSTTDCTSDGLCHEYRPCHVPCTTAIDYHRTQQKEESPDSSKVLIDEAVTILHPFINRTFFNHSETKIGDNTCKDWIWTECDHSCHQSRISSSSIVTHSNGRYCIGSGRETRSCHIDSCGRSDPCIVPFLVHAIFILGDKRESESPPFWTHHTEENFRKRLVSAAYRSDAYKSANQHGQKPFLFGEGDIDILVVQPWHGDQEESNYSYTSDSDESTPSGIQLILQISIANPKAKPILNRAAEGSRSLLQEVGVVWSNFTSVFLGRDVTSMCDPFDLYPLAKTANLVADKILIDPTFLSLLTSDHVINTDDAGGAGWNKEAFGGFESARLVSSWTIGTQIYDDSVNYMGPLASTSLYPFIKVLHIAFISLSALWILKLLLFVFKSTRLCRVLGIRFKKKLKTVGSGKESTNGSDFHPELELAATFRGSKATKRAIPANMASPREVA